LKPVFFIKVAVSTPFLDLLIISRSLSVSVFLAAFTGAFLVTAFALVFVLTDTNFGC
jgi:hypothetical protein